MIENHPRLRHVLAQLFPRMFGLSRAAVVRPAHDGPKPNIKPRQSDAGVPSSKPEPTRGVKALSISA